MHKAADFTWSGQAYTSLIYDVFSTKTTGLT